MPSPLRSLVLFPLHATERVSGVWLAGFGTSGALAICEAATDPTVQGVAALGAPADFDE